MIIGKLKYLITFIVFLGYSQGLVEVNTPTIKNTWGDEYDTYVHAKNLETKEFKKTECQADFYLSNNFENIRVKLPCDYFLASAALIVNSSPPKLFLKNRSFLI